MRGSPPISALRAGLFAALLVPLPALAGGWHAGGSGHGHHGHHGHHGGHFGHGSHGGRFGFGGHGGRGHGHGFGHERAFGYGHDLEHGHGGHGFGFGYGGHGGHGGHGFGFGYGGGHGDHGYSFSYGYGGSHHRYSLDYGYDGGYAPYSGHGHHGYRSYGYGYGSAIYPAPPVYVAPSRPVYVEPVTVPLEDRSGWSYLAGGSSERALEVFAAQASAHPGAGAPKVGYALSSAFAGGHSRAIWAMRRAFRIDPYGASEVSIDSTTRDRLRQLLGHYESGSGYRRGDDAFMAAALHYLLGETRTARHAAERAVALGDRDASVHNLLDMLPRPDPAASPVRAHSSDRSRYPGL
ncbi:MAG: hypothetical protein ACE5IL_05675 [Myxococcota bacterium]